MDALILAGGENKRFPVTKGFIEINGRPIIESNIKLLKGIFDKVIISTNKPELYFYLDAFVVGDAITQRGPMTGIFSALINQDSSEVFVTACDMPYINVTLIKYIAGIWSEEWDAVIPIFQEKPQPLLGIYSKRIAEKMEEGIKNGGRSLRRFLRSIHVYYINEEEVRAIDLEGRSFININTIEDYQKEIGGKICSG
jgi:molybdopterin-guanine dinucleotide biosynthesis protein A